MKPDRRLGRTGLEVSAVGLGTYCLTLDWGVSVVSARQTLREAASIGVNLFDTAPMYGGGQAQALVGAASADPDAPLAEAVLVDKVGRFEHSILRRRVEQAYRDPELIEGQFRHSDVVYSSHELEPLLVDLWIGATTVLPKGISISYTVRHQTEEIGHGSGARSFAWGSIGIAQSF